jgi:hypothetical protein
MSNRGKSIVTTATSRSIDQAKRCVEKAMAPVADTAPLSPKERQRAVKARRGAQQVVPRVAQLASQYGVELQDMSGDDLVALMETAARLRELLASVETLRSSLKDAILRSESEVWSYTTAAYGALRRIARARPIIRAGLADVEPWLRVHRRPKPSPAPSPAPNGAPATV